MKIAVISHLFPTELHPYSGKFIKDQLQLLNSSRDVTADLIVPTPHTIPFTQRRKRAESRLLSEAKSKRILYLSFPGKRFPWIIQKQLSSSVFDHFRNTEYDLVHVHWLYPDALSIPSLKTIGQKVVLTVHGSDWYQSKDDPILLELFESSLRSADRILYSGPKLKQDMEKVFPWLSEKSELIYNLVDTSFYSLPSDEEIKNTRKELRWDLSTTHALVVANLKHEKGIDLLLDAISDSDALNDIHFHIIGKSDNDAYAQKIHDRIPDHTHLITVHPPVSPENLLTYYHAADFLVLPSRREGFNVSILEAMSTGLPVVCTPVGGNDVIVDSDTGILLDEISSDSIREGVSKMSVTYSGFNRTYIREQVEGKFGKSAFLNRMLKNYRSV